MTETAVLLPASTVPADPATAANCSSCPHPIASHDVTGLRFCAATEKLGTGRTCICR